MVRSIKKQQSKLRVCSEKKLKSRSRKSSKRVSTLNNVSSRKKKQMGGRLKNFEDIPFWNIQNEYPTIKKWLEVDAVTIPIGKDYRVGSYGSFYAFRNESQNYKFKFHVTLFRLTYGDPLEVTITLFSQKDDDNLSPLKIKYQKKVWIFKKYKLNPENEIEYKARLMKDLGLDSQESSPKAKELLKQLQKSKEEEEAKKLLEQLQSCLSSPKAIELLEQLQSCFDIVSECWNNGTLANLKLGDFKYPILFWYWEKYWVKSEEESVTISVPYIDKEYICGKNWKQNTEFVFKIVKISRKVKTDQEETKLYLVNKQGNFYKGAEIFSGTSLANFVYSWESLRGDPTNSEHPIEKIKELIGVDLDEVTSGTPEQMLKDQLFEVIDFTNTKPIVIPNEKIEIYIPEPNMKELETGEEPRREPSNQGSQPLISLTEGSQSPISLTGELHNESPAEAVPTLLEPAPSTLSTVPESDPPLVE